MRFITTVQWLLIFSLLPIYSLWVLRGDDWQYERAIAHAMETIPSTMYMQLRTPRNTQELCTVTSELLEHVTGEYGTYQHVQTIDGTEVTVIRFARMQPTSDDVRTLVGPALGSLIQCIPLSAAVAPHLYTPSLS